MKLLTPLLLLSSLTISLVSAQNPTRTPPTPAQIAQRRVTFLTNQLGLNPSQQQSALTIFTGVATTNATLNASLKTERQSLLAAIQTNNTASINQITTAIGSLEGQLAASDALANASFYQTLNGNQQATFSQSLTHGPGLGGFGMRGRQ